MTATSSYTAIDVGGPASGNWISDADFNGGFPAKVSTPINMGLVTNPAPEAVYQTQRFAPNLIYTIPGLTPNAAYTVRLHFAETYFTSAAKRLFSVKLNSQTVLTTFDIFQTAGGQNIAVIKAFNVTADATGRMLIEMSATVNNASIAGIEIISGSNMTGPTSVTPNIAINVGGGSSGSWSADTDYSGGWIASTTNAINTSRVQNAAPQVVYQSQRTGNAFTYAVPGLTPNGAYTVRLHFVESWFTGAAQRLFNVTINGIHVLTNFDIYAATGGSNIAIVEPFSMNADATGRIMIQFAATVNNASTAGIEIISGASGPTPTPTTSPTALPTTPSCAPTASNPIFHGCFTGNSPYHHNVASLVSSGGRVSTGQNAINYWNNGNPLASNRVGNQGQSGPGKGGMYVSTPNDPQYSVVCSSYGICDAATSMTGKKVFIPTGATASPDSDHHFTLIDVAGGQELDMWGGFSDRPGNECEVGTYAAGELSCSWGGYFPFSGNGLAAVPGNSGNAGGVAFGMGGLTAGDILSGHITHALAMIGPCLDNGGVYPGTPGRSSDYPCQGGSIPSGGTPAEPSVPYGALIALKPTVNLNLPPYSNASPYCRVVLKAYQEYGFYADDNSSGWGFRLILNNQSDPGWNTINASMIAGGDASGNTTSADWPSCLNRIDGRDLEAITLNQGDGTLNGGTAVLPSIATP